MYVARGGRTYTGFSMLNPKYLPTSVPNAGPCLGCAAGNCGGCSESKALGFYRPNQAMNRSIYPGQGYALKPPSKRSLSLTRAGRTRSKIAFHPALSGVNPSRRGGLLGLGQDTAGAPAGATLVYNGQVTFTFGAMTLSDLISAIGPILNAEGILITNSSGPSSIASVISTSPEPISIVVQLRNDYGLPNDVKAQIDNAIYQVTSVLPTSTIQLTIAPVAPGVPATLSPFVAPAQGSTVTAAPATDIGTWASQNWPWLVGGAAALYVAREFF